VPPPLGCGRVHKVASLLLQGVCGRIEHYRLLLSVSKSKRSPTLASFNVAQAAEPLPFCRLSVQHWPPALTPCSSSTALHCSAIFRRQGAVGQFVLYVCRRKHRHTRTHKHTHTVRTLQPRSGSLTCIPAFRTWIVRYHLMRHTPIATVQYCTSRNMHLYSNRPPALHRWTGGHPGQPVGEATYAA
jgi:hypothetical protein